MERLIIFTDSKSCYRHGSGARGSRTCNDATDSEEDNWFGMKYLSDDKTKGINSSANADSGGVIPTLPSVSTRVTYDQEEVKAFEIGYKGLHLDDTLQIFASIYHYDYDGYQDELQQFDEVRGAGASIVSNADGITNDGFETEISYVISDRLTLAGNYSYTKTEYGEDYLVFMVDDPVNPVPVFGACTQGYIACLVDDPSYAQDYTVNLKGSPLKGIPEQKYTVRLTYEMDSRYGPVWLLLNHAYTGDFSDSGIERDLDRVESRETTNLSASWFSEDGNLSMRVYVNNLMDNENYYALSISDHEENYRKSVSALPPRTYGLDVRVKF